MRRRRLVITALALLSLTPSAMGSGYATVVHVAARGSLAVEAPAPPSFAAERGRIEELVCLSRFVFFRESDAPCAVLRYRTLLDRKSKWANDSLIGHPLFRNEACDNIV